MIGEPRSAGTGASQHGIGIVTARIIEAMLRDEGLVEPIGVFLDTRTPACAKPAPRVILNVCWPAACCVVVGGLHLKRLPDTGSCVTPMRRQRHRAAVPANRR